MKKTPRIRTSGYATKKSVEVSWKLESLRYWISQSRHQYPGVCYLRACTLLFVKWKNVELLVEMKTRSLIAVACSRKVHRRSAPKWVGLYGFAGCTNDLTTRTNKLLSLRKLTQPSSLTIACIYLNRSQEIIWGNFLSLSDWTVAFCSINVFYVWCKFDEF